MVPNNRDYWIAGIFMMICHHLCSCRVDVFQTAILSHFFNTSIVITRISRLGSRCKKIVGCKVSFHLRHRHWGAVVRIIIGSNSCLSSIRDQSSIWINAALLLPLRNKLQWHFDICFQANAFENVTWKMMAVLLAKCVIPFEQGPVPLTGSPSPFKFDGNFASQLARF